MALQALPWNWTAILDQGGNPVPPKGMALSPADLGRLHYGLIGALYGEPDLTDPRVFFGIDAHGRLGFKASVDGRLSECISDRPLPLLNWSLVTATFDGNEGLSIFIDGQPAGSLKVRGKITPSRGTDILIGKSCRRAGAEGSERKASGDWPSDMVLDGLLDEVKIYPQALTAGQVSQMYRSDRPAVGTPLQWRYAVADITYAIFGADQGSGWGEWADEYYFVYPDGVSTRHQTLWTDRLSHEWQETIVLNQPGTRPEDNIELAAMTLARSWNNPPGLRVSGSGFVSRGYDKRQRAYVLERNGRGSAAALHCDLAASKQSPLINPAFVVRGWGSAGALLKLNGKTVEQGRSFRLGLRKNMEGDDLVIWLKMTAQGSVKLDFLPGGGKS